MSNGSSPAGLIGVLPHLSVGVAALVLVGGVFYLQTQERRFEADRADRDREMVTQMLRESLQRAEQDRTRVQVMAESFLSTQQQTAEQQKRLADAMEVQAGILEALRIEQRKNIGLLKDTFTNENQRLIETVIEERNKDAQ